MAITHTNRFGKVTYLHGYQAVLAGIFMAVTIPIMLVFGFAMLMLPVAAVVAVIAGVIMGFNAGWTLFPILLIVIGGLILAFTRIRIS